MKSRKRKEGGRGGEGGREGGREEGVALPRLRLDIRSRRCSTEDP